LIRKGAANSAFENGRKGRWAPLLALFNANDKVRRAPSVIEA